MAFLEPAEVNLEPRLLAVAEVICGPRHADIGTDHGYLPHYLVSTGKVSWVVAVEKNEEPYRLACKTLQGMKAEVRLGDGLAPLKVGEVDSLSLSGMGGLTMVGILQAYPQRVPDHLVVQCNDHQGPELLRRWARHSGFHLDHEKWVAGRKVYLVQSFRRRAGLDPAYGPFLEVELVYGPHLLRQGGELMQQGLQAQQQSLAGQAQVAVVAEKLKRLTEARTLLEVFQHARQQDPQECLGLLLEGGGILPMNNVAPDPERRFELDPLEVARALARGVRVSGLYHSHPGQPVELSPADWEGARSLGRHWQYWIVNPRNGEMAAWKWDGASFRAISEGQ